MVNAIVSGTIRDLLFTSSNLVVRTATEARQSAIHSTAAAGFYYQSKNQQQLKRAYLKILWLHSLPQYRPALPERAGRGDPEQTILE